jgi:hypothetical protein
MRLFRTGLIAVVALLILTLGTLAQWNPAPITDQMVRRDIHDIDFILGQFSSDVERDLNEAHWATDLGGHLDGAKRAAAEFKRELEAGKTWLSNVKTCDSPSTNCK